MLANKTLLEDGMQRFKKLVDIASHLKHKINRRQRQESEEDSDS